MDLAKLREPFDSKDIEIKVEASTKDKKKSLIVGYLTSRVVVDRLDQVVGPENWEDQYLPGPNGGVLCGISIWIGDKKRTRWDGADNTKYEAVKGGLSDAFKRAGVKWGIGRYLYDLDGVWVDSTPRGANAKGVKFDEVKARQKLFGTKPIRNGTGPRDVAEIIQIPKANGNGNIGRVECLARIKSLIVDIECYGASVGMASSFLENAPLDTLIKFEERLIQQETTLKANADGS